MKFFNRFLYFKKRETKVIDITMPRGGLRMGNFAFADLMSVFNLIFSRLKNAEYSCKVEFISTKKIISFVEENMKSIFLNLFYQGFVIINTEELKIRSDYFSNRIFSDTLEIPTLEGEIIIVSDTLKSTGKSDFQILKSKVDFLDTINNVDWSLIDSYGAMGILSPDGQDVAGNILTFSKNDREEIQKDYSENYGLNFGKWKLLISKKPLKFSQISLPIKALEISEKRRGLILDLCAYLNIPKELHPIFENSKYKNLEEAEVQCYTNCIQSHAEIAKSIIEEIYNEKRKTEHFLIENEFWHDFNNVYSLENAKHSQILRINEELEFWQKIKITEPHKADVAQERIDNLIENL